ncbi:MAG: hypothetical protein K5907_05460 [Treponema sp.]|nr:hypothetical protein [Treponema sp.]
MDVLNLMREVFPKTIDKDKPVFASLIANKDGTAALQKQILDLFAYMNEWTSTPNIYEQTGNMLQKTVSFFSYLEQFSNETESSLKNRFKAIFVRNHDEKWGTPFDVKNVFKQYFPHANIYLVENTNKIDATEVGLGNLFTDGDIDTETPDAWVLTNCFVTSDAKFSKKYGIELNQNGGVLSQAVDINPSSVYFLHFFLKGKISVQIKDNSNKYWNFSTKSWESTAIDNVFETSEWDNQSLFFITTESAESVNIYFKYVDQMTYIDYFRLFKKQPYSSFTIIAHFTGNTAAGVFGLAGGEADPNIETTSSNPPQPRYSNYGYYDKSFLSGVPVGFANDIYEDLLDYLRAQGVKAYLDIIVRDY